MRLGIGYLSEDRKRFGLATGMDVRDNIVMPCLSRFLGPWRHLLQGARHPRDGALATSRGCGSRRRRTPRRSRLLSGGNQQKVVIAKWLLRDCEILFFDEPTRGIDVGAKNEIYKLLNALAAQGRAIIVISSELPEILRMSHRIAVMCEGRLTGELPGGGSDPGGDHAAGDAAATALTADAPSAAMEGSTA